jgi:hypothetical protein
MRWLAAALNAVLIVCAIVADVTLAGSGLRADLAAAVALTAMAAAMLPFFWVKTRKRAIR